ncbi:MAG: hypothetical protein R2712_08725 [Vicinamibacterales bacterium]
MDAAAAYRTPATDPLVFGAATLLITIVAGVATAWPAIAAGQADPAVALRGE